MVIATPTHVHAPMIERAAAAGNHVFCEKPIALDEASTERAIEAARTWGVKLQVGVQRRFDRNWAAAAERIHSGEIGQVYFFRTTLRDMRSPSIEYLKTSGGLLVDMAIHDFDAARWMIGEVTEVTSIGAAVADPAIGAIGDVDHAITTLRFANGALGVIDNSRAAGYGYECTTEVLGSRGTLRIDNPRRAHVEYLTPGRGAFDRAADFAEQFRDAYVLEPTCSSADADYTRRRAILGAASPATSGGGAPS